MGALPQHPLIGQVVAERYRVIELLGEGGMGAVYAAEHLTLGKQVALKVVHPEHAGNAEHAARFAREAMVTSRIDHPNVISAIDYGTLDDGTAYLAVQLVRGPSLNKVLADEGRLPWMRAADLGAQIADALCAAEQHGVVHRDLKPDNVLLSPLDDGGELVKVLDFGVAKFARDSLMPEQSKSFRDVTQAGLVIGTPGYMSPEQSIGQPTDHRSDMYALGVILWECIVGHRLWDGTDLQQLVERQFAEAPPRLRVAADDASIPETLEGLVAKLLERRPEDRPREPAIVRDALREILHEGVHSRVRSGARSVSSRRTPTGLRKSDKPSRRTPTGLRKSDKPSGAAPAAPHKSRAVPVSGPKSRRPSARPAWLITVLMLCIVGGALVLVATGQLELRPKGNVAEVAQSVAKQLNLPPPTTDEPGDTPEPKSQRTGLPLRLEPLFEQMIIAEDRDVRVSAANTLLTHMPPDDVPAYVRRMAALQLGKTCGAKRNELEELKLLGDVRALPLLIRLSQKSRGGCGHRGREDCLACLRRPLSALIGELESKISAGDSE